MEHARFFQYRTGNTFLHTLPPPAKILLMLLSAVTAFYLPVKAVVVVWLCVLALSMLLSFPLRDIISDLRPVFFYVTLLYAATIVQHAFEWRQASLAGESYSVRMLLMPQKDRLVFSLQLALSLSFSSLFFRTTSNVQFHEGFESIELFFTRQKRARFADLLSLTLTFIPGIVANWQQIDTAWKARGGKNGIRKILTLVPRLFSVSMGAAYEKALAIENRQC